MTSFGAFTQPDTDKKIYFAMALSWPNRLKPMADLQAVALVTHRQS